MPPWKHEQVNGGVQEIRMAKKQFIYGVGTNHKAEKQERQKKIPHS